MVALPTSWLAGPRSDPTIFRWSDEYVMHAYRNVGLIEFVGRDRTEARWDSELVGYQHKSASWVSVLERIDAEQ